MYLAVGPRLVMMSLYQLSLKTPNNRVVNLEHLKFPDPTDQLCKQVRLLLSHIPTDNDPIRPFSCVGIWDRAFSRTLQTKQHLLGGRDGGAVHLSSYKP